MPRTLWKACAFDLSILIWGYEVAGETIEVSAMAIEHPQRLRWDKRKHELVGERWHGNERREIPEWWALPYLCHAMLKGLFPNESFT
jgi:hypothetical protein